MTAPMDLTFVCSVIITIINLQPEFRLCSMLWIGVLVDALMQHSVYRSSSIFLYSVTSDLCRSGAEAVSTHQRAV